MKTDILLETCFDSNGRILYQIKRNTVTNEYYFYVPDTEDKLKKKYKSFDGTFEKERRKYGPY